MPNIVYTVAEKVEMVRQFWQGLSYRHIVDHFAAANPDRPIPSKSTVQRIVHKFNQTGNVNSSSLKVIQPRKRLSEEMKLDICLASIEDGKKPTARIAQEVGVCKSSVWKVLRVEHFWAYKFQEHQELLPADALNRMIFCETMMDLINLDEDLTDRICFTDEATIVLVGKPNRQNVRAWSKTNPNLIVESGTQYQQKINVWVGMIRGVLIGPIIIDGNLTGDKYLVMLREHIVPAIRVIEGNGQPIWFQQDGAPPHYAARVRAYLNEQFPNRWLGRGGPIQWPARSPDLAPPDYGLWNYLKNRLYTGQRIENLYSLQNNVIEILGDMNAETIRNITQQFYDRLGYCSAVAGHHSEHRLKQRRE